MRGLMLGLLLSVALSASAQAHPHSLEELLKLPFCRLLQLEFTPARPSWAAGTGLIRSVLDCRQHAIEPHRPGNLPLAKPLFASVCPVPQRQSPLCVGRLT